MYIRTKIRVATSVIAALIAASVGFAVWSYQENDAAHAARSSARELATAIHDLTTLTTEYLIQPSDRVRDQWSSRYVAMRRVIEDTATDTVAASRFVTDISVRAGALAGAYGQLSELSWDPGDQTAERALHILAGRALAESEAMMALTDAFLAATEARTDEAERSLFLALAGLAAIATLAFVVMTVMIRRTIVAPVLGLVQAVSRMERGDLDTPLQSGLRNEIGDLTRQIDETRAQLRRTLVSQRAISALLRHRDQELQQYAADLTRSNEDLAQFAYVASHDLRTPLRGIDNLALWIEEDAADFLPDSAREHLEMMRQRIHRMEQLLQDLLAYAQAGCTTEQPEEIDTRALAEQVVEMVAPPAGFTVAIAPVMPVLHTVRLPLQQVLGSLVTNAVQHHDRTNGRIGIDAAAMENGWCFSVSDDGPGIPPQHHDRVFEMFQTLKPKDQTNGTGMGLALVHRLVQRQGGRVWITPAAGPRGTVVHVYWPEAANDINSPALTAAAADQRLRA